MMLFRSLCHFKWKQHYCFSLVLYLLICGHSLHFQMVFSLNVLNCILHSQSECVYLNVLNLLMKPVAVENHYFCSSFFVAGYVVSAHSLVQYIVHCL